jgi:hypothetical protein
MMTDVQLTLVKPKTYIYQDADPMKNMSYTAIVKALSNLQNTGLSLQAQFIVLNQYSW